MGFLKSNFRTTPKGSSAPIQRQLALDAAKLAGSIVVFKRGKEFVAE
jgi:hypothetical protein